MIRHQPVSTALIGPNGSRLPDLLRGPHATVAYLEYALTPPALKLGISHALLLSAPPRILLPCWANWSIMLPEC